MKINGTSFVLTLLLSLVFLSACNDELPELSDEDFLREHIEWLASDDLEGRLAGTLSEAKAANYISDRFLQYGVLPAGDDRRYIQQFTLTGPMADIMGVNNHQSRNVVGKVEGTENADRYIIIGAHYDGQGTGGMISMSDSDDELIHNSADDNASGTAGLLMLANHFSANPPANSVKFVAFSGEEVGLLGSRHFTDTMEIDVDSILAMINLDMIGRLDDGELTIFGTGTATIWDEMLEQIQADSLSITKTPSGSGSSDHTPFYEKGIPVLHYYSGTHEDYHRETDTADKINYRGMTWVLEHVKEVISELDRLHPEEIEFQETTDPRSVVMGGDSVTLGVIPDYTFDEGGFRIESVRPGNPGEESGLQDGDIIIEMDGQAVGDIYDYMEMLNDFETGDEIGITILRGDEEIELTVQF